MGGGLMQLVAYGAQDIYLTGNPQITFFKVVYRRHTNFSMEHIQQTFKGTPVSGARVVATVSRNGDLIHDCYIRFKFKHTGNSTYINNPGNALINNVEVEIGGQSIDKQYGHFMEAHAELTEKNYGDNIAINSTVNNNDLHIGTVNNAHSSFQQTTGSGGISVIGSGATTDVIHVPLRFWFCRHIGLSLPLIALQYHEVNINITFSGPVFTNIGGSAANYNAVMVAEPELWANYIYLDTDERRRFAQVSHEYLIEQVQTQEFSLTSGGNKDCKLNFNHPVKELIWGALKNDWGGAAEDDNLFVPFATDITSTIKLELNGHSRFAEQTVDYFTRYQPYKYHENLSRSKQIDTIGVYSFALKPEEHQPSGTCNFSRIDSSIFVLKNTAVSNLKMYAINYNVLRIMSGMGGLAYSN